MWTIIIQLLPFLLELIDKIKKEPDCPGGICDPIEKKASALQVALNSPSTEGLLDFFRCVDFIKAWMVVKQLISIVADAIQCGGGKSIIDFVRCVDKEAFLKAVGELLDLLLEAVGCDPGTDLEPGPVPQ